MKKLKSKISIFLTLILTIAILGGNYITAKADDLPRISFFGVEHSPLVEGETEGFIMTAVNASKVEYKFSLTNLSSGNEELLSDFSYPVAASVPYEFKCDKIYSSGAYMLNVTVRRDEDGAQSVYQRKINCVNKDDSNRIYVNGDLIINNDRLNLGDTVSVIGVKKINGMPGNYKYKLHVYDVDNDTWLYNVTSYGDDIKWTPSKPGVYILDVHINSDLSPAWAKVLKYPSPTKDQIYGTYEAYKLKMIIVGKGGVPTGLRATAVSTSDIQLYWDKVPGADYYKIYRSQDNINFVEAKNSDGENKWNWYSDYCYTLTNLSPKETRYFKVTAVINGKESNFSNTVYATSLAGIGNLTAPTGLKATAISNSEIHLYWDKSTIAEYYKVYVSQDNVNFQETKNNNGENKFYWDSDYCVSYSGLSSNEIRYFRVTAVANGKESNFSNTVSATTLGATVKPTAPTGVTVTYVDGKMRVYWNKVEGADYYKVFLSTDNVKYTDVLHSKDNSNKWYWDSDYCLQLSDIKSGQTYYFKIIAVKGDQESDPVMVSYIHY